MRHFLFAHGLGLSILFKFSLIHNLELNLKQLTGFPKLCQVLHKIFVLKLGARKG